MALIRKRLRVEMWMYERLQELYGAVSACNKSFCVYFVYNNVTIDYLIRMTSKLTWTRCWIWTVRWRGGSTST